MPLIHLNNKSVMFEEFLFKNREDLFSSLANDCQHHLAQALSERGKAGFMVSGGSTPAPLYQALSNAELDWRNIAIALVDERWVAKDHPASNEALIERTLLINNAKNAPFTGMKTVNERAADGCATTESHYRQQPQPFTATILGMGNDGHTASLFPHADGLTEALNPDNEQLTAAIIAKQSEVTGTHTERLSLTLNGLLKSERLIVLLTGEDKLAVFRKALAGGEVEDMPIRAILQQDKVPVLLYWAA
jgi:6-phosphogluconolactonase